MLIRNEIKTIITTAIIMSVGVHYVQNIFEFGSEERVNFYFSQMAYIEVLFAYAINKILNTKVTHFWIGYVVGELINEVLFKGELSYIEIIIGALSLLYYFYRRWIIKNK